MYFFANQATSLGADLGKLVPLYIIWGVACVILLIEAFARQRARAWGPALAALGLLAALMVTLQNAMEMEGVSVLGGTIATDPLANIGGVALLLTGLLSVLMAWTYLRNRGLEHGEYYVLLLLSISGAILMAAANDLIVLFLGLEVLSFGLYVLAGFARTEERSEEASIKYFLLGAFASAFFLYGIALVYGAAQSTNLDAIRVVLSRGHALNPMMLAGIALMLVGLGFKAAVIPFHQWTPDVYEGAPTSVTAYMAGAAKIGAFVALLRVFDILAPLHAYWLPAMRVLAILTMVFGNILAVQQTNVKRMLAYSSIAHAGYLLLAIVVVGHRVSSMAGAQAQGLATSGAMFYLFAYVFMTLGAFGVLVYLSNRGKDYQTIYDLRGLVRHDPFAAYTMVFFMLSLGGIPPTMGFIGKWQIFMAAVGAHEIAGAVIMALASVVAAYYYLRIVWMVTFEEPTTQTPQAPVGRMGAYAAVLFSAAATLLLGVFPDLLNSLTMTVR